MIFDIICVVAFLLAVAYDAAVLMFLAKIGNNEVKDVFRFPPLTRALLISFLVLGLYLLIQAQRYGMRLLPSDFISAIPLWWTSFLAFIAAGSLALLWTSITIFFLLGTPYFGRFSVVERKKMLRRL